METLSLPPYVHSETLTTINPNPTKEVPNQFVKTPNPQASLESVINSLFPNQAEENKVTRMRKHLGETAKTLSDVQIETIITEFQFLIDAWMDEYEKEVFNGVTLREVLNGE